MLTLVLSAHALVLALVLTQSPTEIPHLTPPMMVSLLAPPAEPGQPAASQPAFPSPPRATSPAAPLSRSSPRPPMAKPAPASAPETGPVAPAPTSPAPAAAEAPAPPAAPAVAAIANSGGAATGPASSGAITPARYDAAYLNNQTPYPPLARRLGETGTVKLRVLISAEGLAEKIELVSSSGSPRLDEGAQAAVRRWRFIPARQGDQPVASMDIIPIVFTLKEQ